MGSVVIYAPSFWWTKDIRNDEESQYSYLLVMSPSQDGLSRVLAPVDTLFSWLRTLQQVLVSLLRNCRLSKALV